jgi:20S proteasome subunit beta 4
MLIAGYDEESADGSVPGGPSLYFMDYLASCVKLPFAMHGYGSYFGLSICDKYYKKDMNETEAVALLNKIIAEIQKRFLINLVSFHVRVINQKGIRDLPSIQSKLTTSTTTTGQQQQESMDI